MTAVGNAMYNTQRFPDMNFNSLEWRNKTILMTDHSSVTYNTLVMLYIKNIKGLEHKISK